MKNLAIVLIVAATPVWAESPVMPLAGAAAPPPIMRTRESGGAGLIQGDYSAMEGRIKITVTPTGEAALRRLHEERSAYFAKLDGVSDALSRREQKLLTEPWNKPWGRPSYFLHFNADGDLMGGVKLTGDPIEPTKLIMWPLKDKEIGSATITNARHNDRDMVAVLVYHTSGLLSGVAFVEALDMTNYALNSGARP